MSKSETNSKTEMRMNEPAAHAKKGTGHGGKRIREWTTAGAGRSAGVGPLRPGVDNRALLRASGVHEDVHSQLPASQPGAVRADLPGYRLAGRHVGTPVWCGCR